MKITITRITQDGNDQDAIYVKTIRDIKKTANSISEYIQCGKAVLSKLPVLDRQFQMYSDTNLHPTDRLFYTALQ